MKDYELEMLLDEDLQEDFGGYDHYGIEPVSGSPNMLKKVGLVFAGILFGIAGAIGVNKLRGSTAVIPNRGRIPGGLREKVLAELNKIKMWCEKSPVKPHHRRTLTMIDGLINHIHDSMSKGENTFSSYQILDMEEVNLINNTLPSSLKLSSDTEALLVNHGVGSDFYAGTDSIYGIEDLRKRAGGRIFSADLLP